MDIISSVSPSQGEVESYTSENQKGFIVVGLGARSIKIPFERKDLHNKNYEPQAGDKVEFELVGRFNNTQEKYESRVYNIRFISAKDKTLQTKPSVSPPKKPTTPKTQPKQQPALQKTKVVQVKPSAGTSKKKTNLAQEFYRTATMARADERIADARVYFKQALAAKAEHRVYKDFVQMLVEIGDKKEALKIIQRAINAFPNNSAYFYDQRIRMEYENGNYAEARRVLQKGLNRNPSNQDLKRWAKILAKSTASNSHQDRSRNQAELVRQSVKQKFNPYVVGKQVTGDKFIGRQDILADLITALKAGNHLIIEGERRIGKTSILYKLVELLRQDQDYCFIPAYVQLQQVEESELFYAMMRAVARESRRRCDQLPALRCETTFNEYGPLQAEDDLFIIVGTLRKITSLPVLVIVLLDEGDRLRDFTEKAHRRLRGWMGSEVSNEVLLLVWCGVSFDKTWHQHTSPWYNQFRSAIKIPPLSSSEAKLLITQPVQDYYQYENQAIVQILKLSDRKPFVIQLICDECIKQNWQKGNNSMLITETDVLEVWPQVQARLASDEQAYALSDANTDPIVYQSNFTTRRAAERSVPYSTESQETPDDA